MRTPPEMWRDVPGSNGKYQASRAGDVRHVWPSGKTTLLRPYTLRSECHKRKRWLLHVHLTIDGKAKIIPVHTVIAKTWKGECPPGMCWHHANGHIWDNRVENIQPITRQALGKKTGATSTRKSVEMIDAAGNVAELYPSIREAARCTHMSYTAIVERCKNRVKNPYELTGYTFRYER